MRSQEFYALLSFATPGVLGPMATFKRVYAGGGGEGEGDGAKKGNTALTASMTDVSAAVLTSDRAASSRMLGDALPCSNTRRHHTHTTAATTTTTTTTTAVTTTTAMRVVPRPDIAVS
jgi:hypothetical protein